MKRWVWASGGVLGSVFFAALAHAQCTKDTDCKGDRVCEAGQCQEPAPLPAPPPPPPAAMAEPTPTPAATPAPAPSTPPAPEPRAGDAEPAPRYHRRSPGLITAGIITTSAAPLVLVIGAVLSTNAYNDCTGSADYYYRTADIDKLSSCQDARETRAVGIIAGTLVLLGAGIPMIIYGAKKVPDTEPQARVTPWLSPTSAGLSLRLSL